MVHILVLAVQWIGIYTKYLTERAQRKAFLETHHCFEMSLANQKKNKQQHELLHSVLPGFIVNQMIQDVTSNKKKSFFAEFQSLQFHKAEVHHYEQVSILFADIKGFMGKLLSVNTLSE